MSKTLNTRISQKHDFEVNWMKAVNFIPNAGEIIVYDSEVNADGDVLYAACDSTTGSLPNGRSTPYTTARIKVGDGIRKVNDLEFASSASGLNESDEFVFYCGDSDELVGDPYGSAEYVIACGDADSVR